MQKKSSVSVMIVWVSFVQSNSRGFGFASRQFCCKVVYLGSFIRRLASFGI